MKFSLSISIPTYNRAEYLSDTIECFAKQIGDRKDIQIAVADNCSNDQTDELIEALQLKYPYIKYIKNDKNLGADRNYLKAVEISDGEFCWLFGSDDLIDEGSLEKAIHYIEKSESEIILFNRMNMSPDMTSKRGVQKFFNVDSELELDFSKIEDYEKYSSLSCDIAAVYSYLSSIIVSKSHWDEVEHDEELIGGAYIHVNKILKMMDKGARFYFSPEPLVLNRMDNDFFAQNGYVKRRLIDVGYVDVIEKSISSEEKKRPLREIITREFFTISKLLAFKMWTYRYQDHKSFLELYKGHKKFHQYKFYQLKMMIFKYTPTVVLRLIYKICY